MSTFYYIIFSQRKTVLPVVRGQVQTLSSQVKYIYLQKQLKVRYLEDYKSGLIFFLISF